MKLTRILVILSLFLSNVALANHMDQKTINDRTAPVGKIYKAGDKVPTPVVVVEAAPAEPRTDEQVVTAHCAMCHGNAGVGAPVIGVAADWAPRAAKGIDLLLQHATSGFNAMPPKGMCADCSADELKGAIEYMLSKSK